MWFTQLTVTVAGVTSAMCLTRLTVTVADVNSTMWFTRPTVTVSGVTSTMCLTRLTVTVAGVNSTLWFTQLTVTVRYYQCYVVHPTDRDCGRCYLVSWTGGGARWLTICGSPD